MAIKTHEKGKPSPKRYWLLKSEPSTFSFDDLLQSPQKTTQWEGVRNYQARNFIRDEMQAGDEAFFYHSSCKEPGIVGIVTILDKATPDVTAFDPNSDYFDPKSHPDSPRWFVVNVKFQRQFDAPITLKEMRENPKLRDFTLLRKGNRLSVIPVTPIEANTILSMNT